MEGETTRVRGETTQGETTQGERESGRNYPLPFEHMVDRIYLAELQLNKANSSDTEAPF